LKIANASDARFYNEEGEPFSGTQRLLNLENNSLKIKTEVDEGVIKSRTVFHDTGEVHNRIEYEYRGDTLVYSKSIINGKFFQENFYPSISESGMLVTKTYFPNGQIQHESQQLFVDETGSYQGLMTLYDEEGNILEQDLYDNGKLIKNLITSGRSRDIVTPDNKKLD
jgi:antitoxin component YwqK of YwqJK toxin-antitoxin module